MFPLYLFSLILGGGFLAVSVFGDFLEDSPDVDLDVDADVDVDLDASGGDAGHAARIFSFRTVVYALFGFGGVGTLLTALGQSPALTAVFAVAGGLSAGALIHGLFSYLKRSDTGERLGEATFVGLPARVTLPLVEGYAGEIVVRRGDREYRLRARVHETVRSRAQMKNWKNVIVIDMAGGVALVAPVEDELLLEP